jgi:hypothetical protein
MIKVYDICCKNCGYVEEMWLEDEDLKHLIEDCWCGSCKVGELYIGLGSPQFSIKGPGVYDPGKH